jgi:hypothetical protein
LDRDAVRRACERAEREEALVITMAWGFANTGYGPHRVQKILATDGLADRLVTVLRALRQRGPVEAYSLLAGKCHITGLGPAFGAFSTIVSLVPARADEERQSPRSFSANASRSR